MKYKRVPHIPKAGTKLGWVLHCRVRVTPASPLWVSAGVCRAATTPEMSVCDTLRNHPGEGQERDTQGLQHQGVDKGMNKHGGNRAMHQRTGRTALPAAHVG